MSARELAIDEVIIHGHGRAAAGVDAFREALAAALRALVAERGAAWPSELRIGAITIEAPPELEPEPLAARVAEALRARLEGEPR